MADPMQQAREQFEAWASGRGWSLSPARTNCDVEAYGMYNHPGVQRCWEAWEAAALRAAPEGPETHYHCADGIHGTLRRLRRYAKQGDNKNSLQGQTMEEAAAFIERALSARPQVQEP